MPRLIKPMVREITDEVRVGSVDGEHASLLRCACGRKWSDWDFFIGVYADDPKSCPSCGRMMFFKMDVKVYEVQ